MLPAENVVVSGLLVTFVARSFLVFGALALAVGIGLMVNAQGMHRLFGLSNRWVSTRSFFSRAETPRDADALLTRNRYLFSFLVMVGALYTLFGLIAVFDLDKFMALANAHRRYRAFAWGVQIFWWCLVLGNLLAFAVGFMRLVFPSQLERLARVANRWIGPVLTSESADRMNMTVDNWVEHFPRISGAVIAAGAMVVVILFARLLS